MRYGRWVAAAVVMVLLLGTVTVLYIPVSTAYLTGWMSAELSGALHSRVEIEKATVMLAKEVRLQGLSIRDGNTMNVTMEDFRIRYKVLPLLRKRLVGRCEFQGVDLFVKEKNLFGLELVSSALGWDEGPLSFTRISCDLRAEAADVSVSDLRAEGPELKVVGEMTLREGNELSYQGKIFFRKAEEVLPAWLKGLLIQDSESGWLGLSQHATNLKIR